MENETIKELNEFLKGQYMGIHSYEHYIQKLTDPLLINQFQKIQQDHKHHAMIVAERIQNLGGKPVDNEGMIGSFQRFISQLNLPDTTEGLIKGAMKGEGMGITASEKIVRGDLDEESRRMVEDILDKDREHLQLLQGYLH